MRRRKRRRAARIRRTIRMALITGLVVIEAAAGAAIIRTKDFSGEEEALEAEEQTVASVPVILRAPEKEDGSGRAGEALRTGRKTILPTVSGWQEDSQGWWYACDETTNYINGWASIDGKSYHFDEEGYRDTGWTAIGGQGYYFDENGVYDPEADSSMLVALTFDDGPGPYTGQLLDILESTGARATFFMLGKQVEEYGAEAISRMKELGCIIGSHSYDHTNLKAAGPEVTRQQFAQTDEVIAQYNDGEGAQVIRFPYGDYTKELSALTERPCIFWDVDSLDWDSMNAQAVVDKVSTSLDGGDIVLMHDVYESTVEACATLIPQLQSQGYELVNIQELAAANGYELEPGVTYFGFTTYEKEKGTVTDQGREVETKPGL